MAKPIKGKADIETSHVLVKWPLNNDPETGKIMADAFDKVGPSGVGHWRPKVQVFHCNVNPTQEGCSRPGRRFGCARARRSHASSLKCPPSSSTRSLTRGVNSVPPREGPQVAGIAEDITGGDRTRRHLDARSMMPLRTTPPGVAVKK